MNKRKESPYPQHAGEWHKSNDLIWALVRHPAGGFVKVNAVKQVLAYEASYQQVARRAGVSVAVVQQWEADLHFLVERDFWRAYLRRQQEEMRPKVHPFILYYAD